MADFEPKNKEILIGWTWYAPVRYNKKSKLIIVFINYLHSAV